jgi:SNF2 family DNA or RNA helicase
MGLGKTVQCVSLLGVLSETVGHRGPFLVVVPLSTVPNWAREFKKWTPEARARAPVPGLGGFSRSQPCASAALLGPRAVAIPTCACCLAARVS